jgi:hypothetical protein
MRAYAVVTTEAADEAVELFLERSRAEAFVSECLRDEPDWIAQLSIVAVELDERSSCEN